MVKAYIDRINVYGFKSYGNRKITIPLGRGFIGIVGPNGSGKSNIGDAIVFALGLATAKSMRAVKLTDLIFSSKGKSAEFAEVEVVFKNEGAFPLNSEEVSIYRKVDRSGKSIYKINGRTVKYYEIEELLSEANIPKQAYNIITQGDIFRFIKMTPNERRDLLSELAGITEFEEKKTKALADLEEVKEKLNSAKLVLKEIRNSLEKLEEEKKNAEKAKNLEDKIYQIKEMIKGVKLYILKKNKRKSEERLNKIESEIKLYLDGKESIISEQKQILSEIKTIEDKISTLQKELLPFKEKEGSINTELRMLKGKNLEIEKEIAKKERLIQDLKKKKDLKLKELENLNGEIEELEKRLRNIDISLKKAEKDFEEKNNTIQKLEKGGEDIQKKLSEIEKTEKYLKQKEGLLEREKLHLELDKKRKEEKIRDLKLEIERLKEDIDKSKKSLKNIEDYDKNQGKRLKSLESELKRFSIRKENLEKRLKIISKKKEEVFKELAQVLAKLSQVREDRVSSILKDINGVYGQVGELITVKDTDLIKAVEISAGSRLKNIVVEDDKVAELCIKILKEKRIGRATFIPLNKIRVSKQKKPPLYSGVYGLITDFLEYPKEIEKAIIYVFGDTVLVEDFNSARNLGIGSYRMITVDGELFEKSGVITGGATDRERKGFLGRGFLEKEKDRLEKEKDNIDREEDLLISELKTVNKKINDNEREILKIKTEIGGVIARVNELKEMININEKKIENFEGEIFKLGNELVNLEGNSEEIKKDLEIVKKELNKLSTEKENILKQLEAEGLKQLRKEWEEALNKVYKYRELKNDLINQIDKIKDKRNLILNSTIKEIEQKLYELKESIKDDRNKIKMVNGEISKLETELNSIVESMGDKEIERKELLKQIENKRKKIEKLRKREEEINRDITLLLEEKGKLEQKIEDLNYEITELKKIYNGKEIDGNLNKLQTELKHYEELRTKIGAVNQRATEDYEETKNRYNELKEKVDKLLKEKKTIEEFIQDIETKKIKAFMEVFNSVNKNLNKVFKQLSPSGKAYLELEDEENPLEHGIFLKARPRGKDVKRLEIMSGGEKTLTALAFLFAVQQYKPSPFYYFDEVDAHLDDANAKKIALLMKELSKEAQFIVVTLRDTMASFADKLIGVSSKNGISQIFTLNLQNIV